MSNPTALKVIDHKADLRYLISLAFSHLYLPPLVTGQSSENFQTLVGEILHACCQAELAPVSM